MKSLIYAVIIMVLSTQAHAITDYSKSVGSIGAGLNPDAQFTGNFKVKETLSTDCMFGIIYFDITTNVGKAIYSTILTAKASSKKLSRIDYNQNGAGQMCTLTYVEIES